MPQQFANAAAPSGRVTRNDAAIARLKAQLGGQRPAATDAVTGESKAPRRPRGACRRAARRCSGGARLADTETPVAAALKLIEPGRGDFLLESVEGGSVRGRHSLIGLAPDLVFRATGDEAEINARWLTDRDAFAPLRRADARRAARAGRALPDGRARRAAPRARLPRRLFRL